MQVQNALNKRVELQCSLLLTTLDLPRDLSSAEVRAQDDVRLSEVRAANAREDAEQVAAQMQHLADQCQPADQLPGTGGHEGWVLVQSRPQSTTTSKDLYVHEQEIDAEVQHASRLLKALEAQVDEACAA